MTQYSLISSFHAHKSRQPNTENRIKIFCTNSNSMYEENSANHEAQHLWRGNADKDLSKGEQDSRHRVWGHPQPNQQTMEHVWLTAGD